MQTLGRAGSLVRSIILMLVFSMLIFPVSGNLSQLPDYNLCGEGGLETRGTSMSAAHSVFQYLEMSEEAGGNRTAETVKKASAENRADARLSALLLMAVLLICIRIAATHTGERRFPFHNTFIHSRRIILRYQKRQDGVKIH